MKTQITILLFTLALLGGISAAQDSLNLTTVGQILYGGRSPVQEVTVSGSYAYLGCAIYGGLRVVDISNPTAPIQIGYCSIGVPGGVAVAGAYAYAVASSGPPWPSNRLNVIHIVSPSAPIVVGYCALPTQGYDVALSGAYAFVADGLAGLRVVDVTTPAAPVIVGSYDSPGIAYGVAISGSYAYLADGETGLRVIDISIPSNPIEVGYYDTQGTAYGVALSGSHAYVADGSAGLRILNIDTPANPVEIGFYDSPGTAFDVAVSGSHAYIADDGSLPHQPEGGLRVVNISNPAAPFEGGYFNTPPIINGVATSGEYVFVTDGPYFSIYQFSPSNLSMALTPINPPIQIPVMGGEFSYTISVANQAANPSYFDAWIMVQMPDSTWYGPVLGPLALTLPANTTLTRLRQQSVPGSAPPGAYWYEGRIGDYPTVILDSSGFGFTKLGSGISGMGTSDWLNAGEEIVAPVGAQGGPKAVD